MREIVVKRKGRLVVRLPFDQTIMDDYRENIDYAQDNSIEINVIGTNSDLPPNSALIQVTRTGNSFKDDKLSNDRIYWVEGEIIETNHELYSIGMRCWFKFTSRWIVNYFTSLADISLIRSGFYNKKMIVENMRRPGIKTDDGDCVYFVSFENAVMCN